MSYNWFHVRQCQNLANVLPVTGLSGVAVEPEQDGHPDLVFVLLARFHPEPEHREMRADLLENVIAGMLVL